MIAFSAENYVTSAPLSDPRYYRWILSVDEKKGEDFFNRKFLMHKCTEEDFSRFNPPADEATKEKVESLMAGGHMFCFDWKKIRFDLFGAESSGLDFTALDPSFIPCASRITLYDGT